MVQLYFLSVLLNILTGLILVYGSNLTLISNPVEDSNNTDNSGNIKESFKEFDNKTFRLIIGIISVFVGILKFISVFRNDIPVVGDLLPAVAGICGGASLLIEFYLVTTTEVSDLPDFVKKIFIDSRKYLGICCVAAGALHFIFPQIPVL